MQRVQRRQILKTAGTGVGIALGAGAASAQGTGNQSTVEPDQASPVATFQATATGGFITLNSPDPVPPEGNEEALRIDLDPSQEGVEGNVEIEGTVYDDMTWEATQEDISFPSINLTALVDSGDLPLEPDDEEITIIPDPISGTYDPFTGGGLVTGGIGLTVDVWMSFLGGFVEREFQVPIPGGSEDPIPVTTGQSNNMTGSAQNLNDTGTSFTLVSNDFVVAATNETIDNPVGDNVDLDEQLNLPAEPPEENWAKFQFDDVTWVDGPPGFEIPGPPPLPGVENPPGDLDGDGLMEDIRGEGTGPTMMDVQTLYQNLHTPEVQQNAEFYNFQGSRPDRVGILDVQALYTQYVSN